MPEAKTFARQICNYMKEQPDHYAPDMKAVQLALLLSDEDFQLGLDWCVDRHIIVIDKPARRSAEIPKVPAFQADDSTQPAEPLAVLAVDAPTSSADAWA